ncbi:hypothetical protein JXA32_16080 [Candidatus Sumerlaeota bacterium]|nr:hypothetical protein [Candidatus Sumerlaeota bacterium]
MRSYQVIILAAVLFVISAIVLRCWIQRIEAERPRINVILLDEQGRPLEVDGARLITVNGDQVSSASSYIMKGQ